MVNINLPATLGGIIGAFGIIVVFVGIFGAWYVVPDGSVGVIFNKAGPNKGFNYEEVGQGFGLKIPFIQQVFKLPFRTQTLGFYGGGEQGQYSAITSKDKNGINFRSDITVRYKIDPTQAAEFIEQKGRGLASIEQVLVTAARADSTRGVFGKYAQEDVPENRIEIAAEMKHVLQNRINQETSGKLVDGFILIEAIDIRNVDFNDEIEARIIEKQKKLQEAQQKVYELQSANMTRQIAIVEADGRKQAAILKAEGEAEAIRKVAFAKAEGIEKVNEAYQNMPREYVQTKFAEAIKETDKVYLGFESLGGNTLPILDVNQLMGVTRGTSKIGGNVQTDIAEDQ